MDKYHSELNSNLNGGLRQDGQPVARGWNASRKIRGFSSETRKSLRRFARYTLAVLFSLHCPASIRAQEAIHDATGISGLCERLQRATVRIRSGVDQSSGVIVSANGDILTVAHGLHAGSESARVVFYDGTKTDARILVRNDEIDIALLKISEPALPKSVDPVVVGQHRGLGKHQLVLAAGFPGREADGISPVVRLGELLAIHSSGLRSSCVLTVGDSGGPLVNDRGELIGLHRQIGLASESNHHVAIPQISKAVSHFLDLEVLAVPSLKPTSIPAKLPIADNLVREICRQRTVELFQGPSISGPAIKPVALGTLLDAWHVATKLSELKPDEAVFCQWQDDGVRAAQLVCVNVGVDLALLKLESPVRNITPVPAHWQEERIAGCEIVFACIGIDTISRPGLVTRHSHSEPAQSGKLGAVLEVAASAGVVQIKDVAPNSTAAAAGLERGCSLTSIDGSVIGSLEDIHAVLTSRQPGDWLTFQFERSGSPVRSVSRFQHDPAELFERTEFLDGRSGQVSERRSGFNNILQHDIPLSPQQCGGPLLDTQGRIVAINISRRARESSLALPIEVVLQRIPAE